MTFVAFYWNGNHPIFDPCHGAWLKLMALQKTFRIFFKTMLKWRSNKSMPLYSGSKLRFCLFIWKQICTRIQRNGSEPTGIVDWSSTLTIRRKWLPTSSIPFVLVCTVNLNWITRSQHDGDLCAIINMSEQSSDSCKVKSLFQTNVAILLPKHWWACSRLMKLKLLIFKKLLLGYEMPEKNPFLPFYKFQTLFVSME